MAVAIPDTQKKRGRPAVGSVGVMVKLPPDALNRLDSWIAQQEGNKLTRPEAIRRLLDMLLA